MKSYWCGFLYRQAIVRARCGNPCLAPETYPCTEILLDILAARPAGRLWKVWEDAVLVSTYEYDANGNRKKHIAPAGETVGEYDDQDRLLSYGATTYTYGENGELETATTAGDVTNYDYDARGNLRMVTLHARDPNEIEVIEYLIDGRDRRVGRKVNGAVEKRWVYKDQLNPVAELDAAGNVVAEFIYGTKPNVPDYMIKDGATYRIVSDYLGSVYIVVSEVTSSVVQRMDYDEFGNVLADTDKGRQPFGFAGGTYDADTRLVRFGARDYDAETGRWGARDPILFGGGDFNVYRYALGDPVGHSDPSGNAAQLVVVPLGPFGVALLVGVTAVVIANDPAFRQAAEDMLDGLLDHFSWSKGERNWERARGDDPLWGLSPADLRAIESNPSVDSKTRQKARKIRKQKEKKCD